MFPYEIIQYILEIKTLNWLKTIPECKICGITYTDGSYYLLLFSKKICNPCYEKLWNCFGCEQLTEQCDIRFCSVCQLPWCVSCIEIRDCCPDKEICAFCVNEPCSDCEFY